MTRPVPHPPCSVLSCRSPAHQSALLSGRRGRHWAAASASVVQAILVAMALCLVYFSLAANVGYFTW